MMAPVLKKPLPVASLEQFRANENFPVASRLIRKKHRPAILAFYHFARTADNVADHTALNAEEKLFHLHNFQEVLTGDFTAPEDNPAKKLLNILMQYNLPNRHALGLLQAFTQDISRKRYKTWSDLLLYCQYSAAPVGRFVLDVHGESKDTWRASDALCMALQILNHLQDVKDDYTNLDRIYLPTNWMVKYQVSDGMLKAKSSTENVRKLLDETLENVANLLKAAGALPFQVKDKRLRMECAVILQLASRLHGKLLRKDPLSQRVKLSRYEKTRSGLGGLWQGFRVP